MNILDTGVKNVKNVLRYTVGAGGLVDLSKILSSRRSNEQESVIFFIDDFFKSHSDVISTLGIKPNDDVIFVSANDEPSTDDIDQIVTNLRKKNFVRPCAIVGMGGGTTMDTAKAVSNLLTNHGRAEDYQGWDLLERPGVYKIAVPTISGTGAEATRTCVMTNKKTGLKLGMNSDFTVFDQIIMDPDLTITVPRDQYFFTGMDAYIHCIESIAGSYRNAIGDAYSRQTIELCRQVFLSEDMMSAANRERLMVASYLGGCAIATSYVGLVHPFSAGLSVVFGLHHCVANCIVMRAMQPYYPREYEEFWEMVETQGVRVPGGIGENLTSEICDQLYASTIVHQKPLTNALGEGYRDILTKEKVLEIFKAM
jgi:3-deoxy-alpha-D-manno-octulosonate 8-oxidase